LQTFNGNKEIDTRGLNALLLKVKQEIFLHTLDINIICFNCCHSHNKMILIFVSITLQKKALQCFQSLFISIPFSCLELQTQAKLAHLS